MTGTYRIVLADDHMILRQGLRRLIEENGDLEVVGEAADGNGLLDVLGRSRAHMAIVDVSMPKLGGIEATARIKKIYPQVKVLILSMHKRSELLHHALSSGADGYVLKEDSGRELQLAIDNIRQGRVYISTNLTDELTKDYVNLCRSTPKQGLMALTGREREVLRFIVDGKSSREIANILFISVRTVENHRGSIMEKMGIKRTVDLVKEVVQKGYLP